MTSTIRNAYLNSAELYFGGNNQENFGFNMKAIDLALNRNCNLAGSSICSAWCPNRTKNEKADEEVMSDETITALCQQLIQAGYTGGISFNRYNEPFYLADFAEKVRLFRSLLPTTKLGCNTNGTLVTAEKLREVYEAGLTSMNFQIYPSNEKDRTEFSREWAEGELKRICERLGIIVDEKKTQVIDGFYYEYSVIFPEDWKLVPDAKMVIYAKKLSELGCNRAGSVKGLSLQHERKTPCNQIGRFLGIDANGDVSPCTNCTGRHLVACHKKYILGNIKDGKIWDTYAKVQAMAMDLTANFSSENLRKYPECVRCNFVPHVQQIASLKGA